MQLRATLEVETFALILPPPQATRAQLFCFASTWAIFGTLAIATAFFAFQAIIMAQHSVALGFGLISAASQVLVYISWLSLPTGETYNDTAI